MDPFMLSAADLAQKMQHQPDSILIIDVRQADYCVGKIRGSHHIPFHLLDTRLDWLMEQASHKDAIIFHCHFSQNRGPRAAMWLTKCLNEAGIEPRAVIYVLEGGWGEWKRSHADLIETM